MLLTDQNAPINGPLLDADNTTSNPGRGKFGEVDADLGGGDTDYFTQSAQHTGQMIT